MIIRCGTHICEKCGRSYDWTARKLEKNEELFGNMKGILNCNVQFFDYCNGRLIATSRCPYCGAMQTKNLVDEEI